MEAELKRPGHGVREIEFGVHGAEEVLALSVLEVKNPYTFDMLGHAVPEGLYDPRLGAMERSDVCPTCYQTSKSCPGHVGHISLPVPVYNPMLFKVLLRLLKGSCYSCKLLLCDPEPAATFLGQMRLLHAGCSDKALDFPKTVQSHLAGKGLKGEELSEEIDSLVQSIVSEMATTGSHNDAADTSSLVRDKQIIIRDFIRSYLRTNKKCSICGGKNWVIRSFYDRKVTFAMQGKRKTVVKRLTGGTPAPGKKNRPSASPSSRDADEKSNADDEEDEDPPAEVHQTLTATAEADEEDVANADRAAAALTPIEAREHMRAVWEKNKELLCALYGIFDSDHPSGTDVLFMDVLMVPPSKFRPLRIVDDNRYAHAQTKNLERIIQNSNNIRILRSLIKDGSNLKKVAGLRDIEAIPGKSLEAKLAEAYDRLQLFVNCIVDADADKLNKERAQGLKQILEKKEGLFRMHMMGKRVNFSARSVISPDPYLNVNEIGVPEYFAMNWTYPVFVTSNNVEELRQMVINGPEIHPGARAVENEDGSKILLKASDEQQRKAVAKSLLANSTNGVMAKKVHRHLINGDILMLNRQPTLHKPSIMAHKARVLKGEKTLRLHYANCKSYNADFDGDEMNAHLPQDEVARSEAYNILNACYQYLVPKDGTPLSGLIQDHIVVGVHLTIRGRFFGKADYEQLVYSALGNLRQSVKFLQPCIMKPQYLWSGKQVISTILINLIPPGKRLVSLRTASKVPLKSWQRNRKNKRYRFAVVLPDEKDMTESDVIFREGELLCGVLDKAQYGPSSFGLVHACFELYGGEISALLLSCLARLFTFFLQILGFSLGVEDVLVASRANQKRQDVIATVDACGLEVTAKALDLTPDTATVELLKDGFEKAHRARDQTDMKVLDGMVKGKVDELNNEITRSCMPFGLYKAFPENQLQTMVLSGAKGATVNCIQMSCLLGQIELEGARPPLMLSGRTLPSFVPYETSPRAGGFVVQRFATGLRPQEYFFHCMAGREGLIDTAVKTSRSGYLQRCIIKHLEGVMVNYDLTVRNSDASVIQFLYGEDGLDIGKTPFFSEKQLPFLMANTSRTQSKEIKELRKRLNITDPPEQDKKVRDWKEVVPRPISVPKSQPDHPSSGPEYIALSVDVSKAATITVNSKRSRVEGNFRDFVEPTISVCRPDISFGSVSEKLQAVMERYLNHPPTISHLRGRTAQQVVSDTINYKYLTSLCQPGEAVGALAGQSIGEPSTQMTLNTFHFAGRGEMNVTLGIPRLREILMTASKKILTPNMEVPVQIGKEKEAEGLRRRLNKVFFSECSCLPWRTKKLQLQVQKPDQPPKTLEPATRPEVVEYFEITSHMEVQEGDYLENVLELRIKLLPPAQIASKTCLTCGKILVYFERVLIRQILNRFKKKEASLKKQTKQADDMDEAVEVRAKGDDEDEGGAEDNREEAESVNSDDEAADPEAAKAQFFADEEYAGDRDDDAVKEWEDDVEAHVEDVQDELEADKENSVMDETGEKIRDLPTDSASRKKTKKTSPLRIESVKSMDDWILDYTYDAKAENWCHLTLSIPVTNAAVDPQSLIDAELKKSVLHQVPNIHKAFLTREKERLVLKTEGVNFDYLMEYDKVLELEKLFSNDVQAVAERFGIEAAMKTIIRECNMVFGAYGIDVNYRHLSLVADYMTVEGAVRAFNRLALTSNSSPFQKMSFETSLNFYRDAVLTGARDNLRSPSAQLVLGERINVGTGLFSLRQPLQMK